jgi:hypothetical protein
MDLKKIAKPIRPATMRIAVSIMISLGFGK